MHMHIISICINIVCGRLWYGFFLALLLSVSSAVFHSSLRLFSLSLPQKSQIKTSLLVVSSSSQGCMSVLCEHTRSYVLVYITSLVNFGIFFHRFFAFSFVFYKSEKNINKNNFYYSCCFFLYLKPQWTNVCEYCGGFQPKHRCLINLEIRVLTIEQANSTKPRPHLSREREKKTKKKHRFSINQRRKVFSIVCFPFSILFGRFVCFENLLHLRRWSVFTLCLFG